MFEMDFLSPFEELVLTALVEAGIGANEMKIWRKVESLAGRNISLARVRVALRLLESEGCVYSWPDEADRSNLNLRCCRVQLRGERALEAAGARRGDLFLSGYFHRASRFGVLWDLVLVYISRKRAAMI
jgi:hypothetical protein